MRTPITHGGAQFLKYRFRVCRAFSTRYFIGTLKPRAPLPDKGERSTGPLPAPVAGPPPANQRGAGLVSPGSATSLRVSGRLTHGEDHNDDHEGVEHGEDGVAQGRHDALEGAGLAENLEHE